MTLEKLLNVAVHAPSGDNCQPWKFRKRNEELQIFNCPERDTSVYNTGQRASLIAHGALLETLSIAAEHEGQSAEITLFPDQSQPNYIASVRLSAGRAASHPLFPYITVRTTNRKRYRPVKLDSSQKEALLKAGDAPGLGRVALFSEGEGRQALMNAVALNDQIVLENRFLHAFLFEHLRWSEQEAQEYKDGMDLATLELSTINRAVFRVLRHWSVVQFMNLFGLSKRIGMEARKQALSASALGLLTIPDTRPGDFVRGGMLLQRVWLEATRLGLSFHLMAGSAFLLQQAHEGGHEKISPQHTSLLKAADQRVREKCAVPDREALLGVFRIGSSDGPSARSLRRAAIIEG